VTRTSRLTSGGVVTNLIKMNRIKQLFSGTKENILTIYFTAGFPRLEDTGRILKALQDGGADMVEVGIPFSDPIADGPTIQASNKIALDNGIYVKMILEQLHALKEEIKIPVIMMGSLNPVYQYGVEQFCKDASAAGVSGMIIPDLPMEEYLSGYKDLFSSYDLVNMFLISPQTSHERIRIIDDNTEGFIYMVSAASTTGARKGITEEQLSYFDRVAKMKLKNPRLIGFGISDHESFRIANTYASGAIIGSAFINLISGSRDLETDIIKYIQSVKGI
jgi:tryptophan synthase alpha chain